MKATVVREKDVNHQLWQLKNNQMSNENSEEPKN